MVSKRIFWILLISLMIAFSITPTQAQTTGQTGEHEEERQTNGQDNDRRNTLAQQKEAIVGAWLATGSDGSKGLLTFHADGTLLGNIQGQVSTTSPLGVFSDGHGAWRHLGGRQFGKVLVAFRYDINTGQLKGFVKVRTNLTINQAGDKMTGTDKLEVFDPEGHLVFAATATATFARVKFEPFD